MISACPYKNKLVNFLNIINESWILILGFFCTVFTTGTKDVDTIDYVGWAMISSVGGIVLANFVVITIEFITTIVSKAHDIKFYSIQSEKERIR